MTGTILVVGGAGYIGSHTCKRLAASGFTPVTFDNLASGHRHAVRWGPLVEGDILDRTALRAAIETWRPDAVIHFAALALVGESVAHPSRYYRVNVLGTLNLVEELCANGVKRIVFSSSCATYGRPDALPITEATPQRPINPYGRTKFIAEGLLDDYGSAYDLRSVALRYFNACGADRDGEIGEEHDPETHLIPRALMAAFGDIEALDVYGDDYDTPDGTCIRDYVHVEDLAEGHVSALRHLLAGGASLKLNLGTGQGASVRGIVAAVERVTGRRLPVRLLARRAGDPACLYADIGAARRTLGFDPRHTDIEAIVRSAWRFELKRRGLPAP